jgi:hypothetical protein
MSKPLHERPLVKEWRTTTEEERKHLRPHVQPTIIFGMRWTTDNPDVYGGSWYDKGDAFRVAFDIEEGIKRAPQGATEIPWYLDTRLPVTMAMEIRDAVRRVMKRDLLPTQTQQAIALVERLLNAPELHAIKSDETLQTMRDATAFIAPYVAYVVSLDVKV